MTESKKTLESIRIEMLRDNRARLNEARHRLIQAEDEVKAITSKIASIEETIAILKTV